MQRRDVEMDSSVSSFEIDDFKNSEIFREGLNAFQRNQRMSDLNSLTQFNEAKSSARYFVLFWQEDFSRILNIKCTSAARLSNMENNFTNEKVISWKKLTINGVKWHDSVERREFKAAVCIWTVYGELFVHENRREKFSVRCLHDQKLNSTFWSWRHSHTISNNFSARPVVLILLANSKQLGKFYSATSRSTWAFNSVSESLILFVLSFGKAF